MRNVKALVQALTLVTALTMWYPTRAPAADFDVDGSMFSVNGFGTVGAVHSSDDKADFTATAFEPNGAGYSRSWSASVDSLIGAQVTANPTPRFSAVLQLIVQQNYDNSYSPHVEWANIKYAPGPNWVVRVGRSILPSFERSDSLYVGYTLPWIRLPDEIRFSNSATHSDGIDVLYRLTTGALTQNLRAQWGHSAEEYPVVAFRTKDLRVLSDTLQYGDTSVHLSYQAMNWTAQYTSPLRSAPPGRFWLASAGFTYDPGTWFVTGDSNYAHYDTLGDLNAWYLSTGVRLGRFTPYVVDSSARKPTPGNPPAQLMSAGDGHTVAAGVRWDFASNLDLKLQLQRVSLDSDRLPASFVNLQPGVRASDKADVASVALDFVF